MPKTCTKFRLGDEEEEEHFFSGIDGSLFIPQEETFYSNDKYCVDYYFDASKFDPSVDLVKVLFHYKTSHATRFIEDVSPCRWRHLSASTKRVIRKTF